MKARRIVADYLQDILDNVEKVQRFVAGVDLETFQEDEEKVYAVVRALEIIGEAARHVSQAWRTKYPQVPWKTMAGMRDKVIHDYFGVDVQVVWRGPS